MKSIRSKPSKEVDATNASNTICTAEVNGYICGHSNHCIARISILVLHSSLLHCCFGKLSCAMSADYESHSKAQLQRSSSPDCTVMFENANLLTKPRREEGGRPLSPSTTIFRHGLPTTSDDRVTTVKDSDQDTSEAGASKSLKKKSWKRPQGYPKRPLSAYNLFFRLGRERLLNGKNLLPITQEDINKIGVNRDPSYRRAHRAMHGKITFKDLARTVASQWKTLNPSTRALFENRAKHEKLHYINRVIQFKKGLLKKEELDIDDDEGGLDSSMTSEDSEAKQDVPIKDNLWSLILNPSISDAHPFEPIITPVRLQQPLPQQQPFVIDSSSNLTDADDEEVMLTTFNGSEEDASSITCVGRGNVYATTSFDVMTHDSTTLHFVGRPDKKMDPIQRALGKNRTKLEKIAHNKRVIQNKGLSMNNDGHLEMDDDDDVLDFSITSVFSPAKLVTQQNDHSLVLNQNLDPAPFYLDTPQQTFAADISCDLTRATRENAMASLATLSGLDGTPPATTCLGVVTVTASTPRNIDPDVSFCPLHSKTSQDATMELSDPALIENGVKRQRVSQHNQTEEQFDHRETYDDDVLCSLICPENSQAKLNIPANHLQFFSGPNNLYYTYPAEPTSEPTPFYEPALPHQHAYAVDTTSNPTDNGKVQTIASLPEFYRMDGAPPDAHCLGIGNVNSRIPSIGSHIATAHYSIMNQDLDAMNHTVQHQTYPLSNTAAGALANVNFSVGTVANPSSIQSMTTNRNFHYGMANKVNPMEQSTQQASSWISKIRPVVPTMYMQQATLFTGVHKSSSVLPKMLSPVDSYVHGTHMFFSSKISLQQNMPATMRNDIAMQQDKPTLTFFTQAPPPYC